MTSVSTDSELRCRLAALAYECRLTTLTFKALAEWLDCYQYILPDNRRLLQVEVIFDDAMDVYNLWQWMRMVECSLTIDEQYLSWKLISES
jgi:hypothetical protein